MIADYYFKDCVPGTTNVIPLANGATEYVCTHKEKHYHDGPAQHKFGTNLFVSTNDGTVNVQIGGNGMGVSVTVYEFQFAASVDSAWHTSRAIVYPSQKTFDNVDNLPKGLQ
ncbi:hypothetical protein BGZ67_002513 [Mortierella alpina]|nr:hypothetical protein BGZ67_002513 [Mortierella alpina]